MKVIEHVARAICNASGIDPDRKFKSSDWSEQTAPHELAWHEFQPEARAALEALRDMKMRYDHPILLAGHMVRPEWKNAIKAALEN